MSTYEPIIGPFGTGQANSSKDVVSLRLRKLAQSLNYNASSLSRASGVPRPTMQKYWTGDRMISAEYIFQISDALKANPRWLITGLGSPEQPSEIDPENADDETKLLNKFRRLEPAHRSHVLQNAEMLLGTYTGSYKAKPEVEAPQTIHDERQAFKSERGTLDNTD